MKATTFARGDRVCLLRQDMWPGIKAGHRATVTACAGDIVELDVDGHGGNFMTSAANVKLSSTSDQSGGTNGR